MMFGYTFGRMLEKQPSVVWNTAIFYIYYVY
jgi:hypothetical protein